MKLITFLSAGALILFSAAKLKQEGGVQPLSLYNKKWVLNEIYTDTTKQEVLSKAFIKFNQEKKTAGGNGGCNSFGSSTIINDNKISFTGIISTKMYCEGVQATEDAFFKQLEKVKRFEIKEKTLLLFGDKDLLLEFASE